MKKKKIFALIMAFIMVFSLAACNSGSTTTPPAGEPGEKTAEPAGAAGTPAVSSGENIPGDPTEGKSMTIKVATVHYDGSVGVRCLEAMKDYLETTTDGRIKMEIYAGSVLGSWTAALDMLYEGDIQLDVVNPVAFETQVPTLALLNNYYTFDDLDHVHRFFEGDGGKFIYDSWNSIGLQGLAVLSLGFRELYNSARPIQTLDDLKGLSIRGYSTIQIAAWKALGVDPVSVDWNELFVSLQQKLIDGEEGAIVNFEDYSFYEVQKYFTMTDHVFSCDMLITNQDWYEGLSEADRALIDEGSRICYEYHRDHYIPENEALLEKFSNEYGIEINSISPDVRSQMAEIMGDTTSKMIIEITGQELYDEYMALVQEARTA